MQQDNFRNALQRIDNQQLPDLSQMDQHWEDMQQLLAAGAVNKPVIPTRYKWLAAAAVLCLLGLFGWKKGWFNGSPDPAQQKQEVVIQPNTQPQQQIDTVTNTNTIPVPINVQPVIPVVKTFVPTRVEKIIPGIKKQEQIIPESPQHNFVANTVNAKDVEKANQQLMQQFWNQLQKKPQQFVIDNHYDAVLKGEEGTTVSIPANA
ncbi:MAG TPA: hypothetical protein VKH37_08535, partial [Ferruginibacter sp.]|nr:hypothetical protein [Ferruginibacter sp.]